MKSLSRKIRLHFRLSRYLEKTGLRGLYKSAQNSDLGLRLRRKKRVKLDGVELLFSLQDEQSRIFFNHPFFSGEHYEEDVTHHLVGRLKDCKCFVDVGANIGFYTVLAAKIMAPRGGVVHAIEMDAENVQRIRTNVRLNDLKNVVVHPIAVGDHQGSVEYYRVGSFRHTLGVDAEERKLYEKVSVPMITLDALIVEYQIQPDIVKIDVEGAEYIVLKGMKELLKKGGLEMYCEVHLHKGEGSLAAFGHIWQEVWDLLHANRFTLHQIPLRRDSKQKELDLVRCADDVTESTMLYGLN